MTQQVGLFGYPLSHSISPAFQQAALDHCSIPARYHRWAVPPERLPAEVERLRGDGYLGANVTIPHKEAVAGLVDEVDEVARRLRAVNTIVKAGGRLIGRNTDEYGFMRSLRETGRFSPEGKTAALLGAGRRGARRGVRPRRGRRGAADDRQPHAGAGRGAGRRGERGRPRGGGRRR